MHYTPIINIVKSRRGSIRGLRLPQVLWMAKWTIWRNVTWVSSPALFPFDFEYWQYLI